MKTNNRQLLDKLIEITKNNINAAEHLKQWSIEILNQKPHATAWNALECLEHLNLYSLFYLPELQKRITVETKVTSVDFKSGIIGNMLVNMVIPKEGVKKMKTFKTMDPNNKLLDSNVIDIFIKDQQELLVLLNKSYSINLNKIIIPVTFSKLLKLKIGDTLRFMAFHNQRHVQQAVRAVAPYLDREIS